MKISWSDLKNLPVVTESGDQLGRVRDIEIEAEEHRIVAYLVAPGRLVRSLQRSVLRVSPQQVITISAEAMVVEDGVRRERAAGSARSRFPKSIVSAISTRAE